MKPDFSIFNILGGVSFILQLLKIFYNRLGLDNGKNSYT